MTDSAIIAGTIYEAVQADLARNADEDRELDALKNSMIKHGAIQLRAGYASQYTLMPVLVTVLRARYIGANDLFALWDMLGGSLDDLVLGRNTPYNQMIYTVAVAFTIQAQATARQSETDLINRLMFAY